MQQTSETTHRLRARTFTCMGTVISLAVPTDAHKAPQAAADELDAATAVVELLFTELDSIFSLYRPDSEASRLVRGELALPEASAGMRARYEEAAEWRLLTEGAFTPERPDGALDLSGIVKGHAIREAGMSLLALGMANWCLNAGGDVLVSGSPSPGTNAPWRAGIVDPADRRTLLAGFPLGGAGRGAPPQSLTPLGGKTADGGARAALATSGSAERGDHIWSATAGAVEFRQVSVAAADVVTADVLATAIVAGGVPMLNRATASWDIEALAVLTNGELLATGGFRRG